MEKYVEALAVIDAINKQRTETPNAPCGWFCDMLNARIATMRPSDVRPVVRGHLVETRTPIEGHPTWYRKHLCCSECCVQIRLESWNEERCFGAGTILRENEMPNFCPNCGADMREVKL